MAIQCQDCETKPANAIYSVMWIDNLDMENASVYLCMDCSDERYGE